MSEMSDDPWISEWMDEFDDALGWADPVAPHVAAKLAALGYIPPRGSSTAKGANDLYTEPAEEEP
ncbi:hypothetical protein OG874_00385 [Nocardia sp. NBC_00565]|uniref:hypothetical protein n=1 Tax=Nocardia sp. NBC_00565 TaxID=2975993 RepID=UPI002E8125B5|nr:hypothetical protein [Nocardia sp. NBC_00565]WUC03712.1 hypothetical protein OG874_00385 [Nocardia sp. NBC_00565]